MTSIARHVIIAAVASAALGGCANCSLDALRSLAGNDREEAKVAAVDHKRVERTAEQPAPKATASPAVATPTQAVVTPPPPAEAATDSTAEKRKWCGQRFIDYQDGKRPGGAETVEQKQADDRVCEALRQNNQTESKQIETGTIPPR